MSSPLEEATGGVISSLEVANLNEELKYCLSTIQETSTMRFNGGITALIPGAQSNNP